MVVQNVIKADGTVEPFSLEKLQRSMNRAALDPEEVNIFSQKLNGKLPDITSTDDIRRFVVKKLDKYHPYHSVRYSIRESMIKLGPSGYAFEQFIGQIFEAMGYHTSCGVVIRGECVTHEIDVMAINESKVDLAECKFHNTYGIKSDVKVALYIWARSQDVKSAWSHYGIQGKPMGHYWLITNTKLTDDATTYAQCKGLNVMSWNYPENNSLRLLIDKYGLYPVTSLKNSRANFVQALVDRGIVTLKQLINTDDRNLKDLNDHDVEFARREATQILEIHV